MVIETMFTSIDRHFWQDMGKRWLKKDLILMDLMDKVVHVFFRLIFAINDCTDLCEMRCPNDSSTEQLLRSPDLVESVPTNPPILPVG